MSTLYVVTNEEEKLIIVKKKEINFTNIFKNNDMFKKVS